MKHVPLGWKGAPKTAEDERPSLAERYTVATGSSHLKTEPGRCDTDLLMAFGAGDGFGAVLLRLRGEYDTARAEHRNEAPEVGHLLALADLQNLHDARERIGRLAMGLNTDEWLISQENALRVAGRVLDVWLDPNCRVCDGRGTLGGTHRGERQHDCRVCSGNGRRRMKMGEGAVEARFAAMLRDWIEGVMLRAQGEAALRLRGDGITDDA